MDKKFNSKTLYFGEEIELKQNQLLNYNCGITIAKASLGVNGWEILIL